jgi:hypothetical protein
MICNEGADATKIYDETTWNRHLHILYSATPTHLDQYTYALNNFQSWHGIPPCTILEVNRERASHIRDSNFTVHTRLT